MSKAQNAPKATQTAAEQPLPMKIDVKIGSIRPDGNVRAYASVNLNDCFAIRNVKIVDSTKGLFIAMPSYKAGNGEYKDICFPVTKEFREQLNQAVVDAYQQALTQSQTQGRQLMEQASQPEQQPGMQMAGL
ncbi:SpoVG family protein [Clostridium sp. HBUAS56010]|uniref:SpoVG family protein n=1 Tax=Clostridium sp. HBUAS56010 TaxID=2571127 RepID=UPI001178726F|nr:SpoVG family protein [Clostridium sp. HBUAS56010]